MARAKKPAETKAVYVISVAAELSGMHPQTLRIYERKGLLSPARTGGGSRRYSDEDVALLRRIAELTGEGMNLVGVKKILALEAKVARLEAENRRLRVSRDAESTGHGLVPLRQSVAIYERRTTMPGRQPGEERE